MSRARRNLGFFVGALAAGVPLVVGVSAAFAASKEVSSTLYVSPTGSDAGRCTVSSPCSSFNRAYQVARSGDVVEVAAGAYGYQRLEFDPTKTSSAHVVFQPAAGASVSVQQIDFGQAQFEVPAAQHVTVRDMRVDYLRAWDGAADLLWLNVRGRTFDVLSGDSAILGVTSLVRVVGGSFGPCQAPREEGCTVKLIGSNHVVDGVTIHGVSSTDLANYHVDGMFIRGCEGCTVRNSKFYGNMITNVRVQNCCGLPDVRNLAFVNNWFAAPLDADGVTQRADGIDIDNPVPGLVIWNNSFAHNAGPYFAEGDYGGGARVIGNLMANLYQGCRTGITYSNNVFIPVDRYSGLTPCGPTDRRVRGFGYADSAGFDYHITAKSPARRAVPAQLCPHWDIDRKRRKDPKVCDAGAAEYVAPPPTAKKKKQAQK